MIIRASFFLVASVGALALSSISISFSTRPKSTVSGDSGRSRRKEEENQKSKDHEFPADEIQEEKKAKIPKSEGEERSVENSVNLIKELKQKKLTLESRLFELYGLKEEYSYIAHLRKELKAKIAEIDGLNLAIESIRAENKRVEDDAREGFLLKKQLEAAKKRILALQENMSSRGNRMKGQLEMLEGQVSRVRNQNRCDNDSAIEKRLEDFSGMELQVLEMKRKNKELELEKRELVVVLRGAHARISNLSKNGESEVTCRIPEEVRALRSSNEKLSEEFERLQKQRFGMVEELVYQRWLNCCLRFEIRSYQKPPRRNSEMCSLNDKSSSSRSRGSSTCSCPSAPESAFVTSSSGCTSSISKKTGLAHKVKTWGTSRIASSKSKRLIRRFSTSVLPSNIFVPKSGGNNANAEKSGSGFADSPEPPRFLRVKRVSFSDIVRKLEPESSGEEVECEDLDPDQPDQDLGSDPDDIMSSHLINGKQNEAVQAVIRSDPSHQMITEKEDEANGEAEEMGARTFNSNGFSDQRRTEVRNVKFITAISALIYSLLLLLCLRFFDFQGLSLRA